MPGGARSWTTLDVLHLESLDKLVGQFGLGAMTESETDQLNPVWHRLKPCSE